MESTLIKDTTKQQRIELIKSWMPQEDGLDDCEIDLFDMYKDYIDGKREIREINESFSAPFYAEQAEKNETEHLKACLSQLKDKVNSLNEVQCGIYTRPHFYY